ncbi:MAG: alpha/beta hydrolase [Rhodospirillales bacterium]
MKLEVISHEPAGEARPTPILFVHGAYGGAWVWERHFLPYFADHGYSAHALSLRGHGASEGWEQLPFARLRHYVDDLTEVARAMRAPPVLVGHSMGGMVVQKYLHAHPVPAAVLLASVPPHGMVGTVFGMAFASPGLFGEMAMLQMFGPRVANGASVRRALFSEDTPDEIIRHCMPRMQAESTMVILDLMGLDLPPPTPAVSCPVLVLGAEKDAFVYRGALEATARSYGTTPEVFPGMAHAMMLDVGWQRVADRMLEWLDERLPGASARQPPPARRSAPRSRSRRRADGAQTPT